ncbi:MAG: hypothetical protein RL095_3778 [Verrucomicrobiota bacterium]|jgi:hypothetical protein
MRLLLLLLSCLLGACASSGSPIQHRFVACDFWKKKLWHVDEARPENNWSAQVPRIPMEVQLLPGDQLLISFNDDGYGVFDLKSRKLVKHHRLPGTSGAWGLPGGHTLVGLNRGKSIVLAEVDAAGKTVKETAIPGLHYLRMIRPTAQGTWLLAWNNGVAEVDLKLAPEKCVIRNFPLPRPRNAYMGIRLADGRTLVGGGYAAGLFEYGADGKFTRELVAPQPPGLSNYFYGGVQELASGRIAVANWTGHDARDFKPGWKLIEFDAAGRVVWHWLPADPEVGTINNFVILE